MRAKTGAKELSEAETTEALQTALAFDITFYNDNELHLKALNLANRFSLPAAYDAHDLALAERFDAQFWTAVRRLVRVVQDDFPWVHLV
ncbi:MAG: type II toxin-antitoxin system VapC family toxin [Candidatus Parabeggiatoa sp.]|nr:type II toxin-antitoxin system VapC family toxin [Candidatus Parabeggiatoa sp.]